MLARLHRLFRKMPLAAAIARLFDTASVEEKIAGELAYPVRPLSGGFERHGFRTSRSLIMVAMSIPLCVILYCYGSQA